METKFKEETERVVYLHDMRNKFLAERLVRGWTEDFIDEDSGEVVSITRTELILEKGTRINEDSLSVINFHIQAGDIKSVLVSNQERAGILNERQPGVWIVTVFANKKNFNLYLYSNSIDKCQIIATDYLEQLLVGTFSFVGIREVSYSHLIPEGYREDIHGEDYFEADYYQLEVIIEVDKMDRTEFNFIVKAHDADDAKLIIEDFVNFEKAKITSDKKYKTLTQNHDVFDGESFLITTVSAKKIKCSYVVDYNFSLQYLKSDD